jgi:hypothetical protein
MTNLIALQARKAIALSGADAVSAHKLTINSNAARQLLLRGADPSVAGYHQQLRPYKFADSARGHNCVKKSRKC